MRITIEVSEKTEATNAPYWLVLDPHQNMKCDVYNLSSQIEGPFFSREEAQDHLDSGRHRFSDKAVVFCLSGWRSGQYERAYHEARRKAGVA